MLENNLNEMLNVAIQKLDEALRTSEDSMVSIGKKDVSRLVAEEMKFKFEQTISGNVQVCEIFKTIPIELTIVDPFWRKLQILINRNL